MFYRLLADAFVLLHLGFVAFVVAGGFLVIRRPRLAWVHLPAAVWGFLIELFGWICPLTYLEVDLRRMGGEAGYSGGFVEHYLLPILYPTGLTRGFQLFLGALVVVVNCGVYGWWLWTRRRERLAGRYCQAKSVPPRLRR
jgi:hypothetical protein